MPVKVRWEIISDIKHAVSQERVILCGIILKLKKIQKEKSIDFEEDINKFKKLDTRFQEIENQLVTLIEESGNGLK